MTRILLIDTNSLFFRAFHGLPPMTTTTGVPTSAVYGFSTLVLKLLREESPKGLAFARDAKAATFRHAEFSDYKAQRDPIPSSLASQFIWLDQLLEALALPTFTAPGFEADDVLATLAGALAGSGEQVRIVSGDRDLFQVLGPGIDMLFAGRRQQKPIIYDAAAVEARFGVPPSQLPSYVALIGDSADNLPGVPGIGPRTASKLIARHHDIATVLEHLDSLEPKGVREALREAAAQVRQNERLARLDFAVPLPEGPRYALPSPAALERVRTLFTTLEFKSLLGRLPRTA